MGCSLKKRKAAEFGALVLPEKKILLLLDENKNAAEFARRSGAPVLPAELISGSMRRH